jgi:hypothetical protein
VNVAGKERSPGTESWIILMFRDWKDEKELPQKTEKGWLGR